MAHKRKIYAPPRQFNQWLAVGLVVLVVFCAYSPVLKAKFVNWDDDVHLYKNLSVRSLDWEHIQEIFQKPVNKTYIPLTIFSFALEYHFVENDPFLYHLTNLLLHLFNVILVFILARQFNLSGMWASFAALLFGLHPTHVESVAWVTERKDVLYSLFYLLALLSYCRYVQPLTQKRPGQTGYSYLILTTFFGLLSLLAKPMALSLPLILILFDWFLGRDINRKAFLEKIPIFLFSVGVGWMTYSMHSRLPESSFFEGVLIWCWTFTFYLKQFIFPFISVPIYRLSQPVGFSNNEYLLSAFIVGLMILVLWRCRKSRWFIFAFLFHFLSIFFLLRYDAAADINIVADRFLYLPSLGFCLWLAWSGQRFFENSQQNNKILKASVLAAMVMVCTLFSLKTFLQSRIWRSSITLWRYQLKVFPKESIALNNLATALRDKELYKKAEGELKEFIKAQPDEKGLHHLNPSVARVNYLFSLYRRALLQDPEYVDAHYNIGNLYRDIGKTRKAVAAYQKAIILDPTYRDAYFNLGRTYQEMGATQKAIVIFEQLVYIYPEEKDVYKNVIKAYNKGIEQGQDREFYEKARARLFEAFTKQFVTDSNNAQVYFNLGNMYNDMDSRQRAIEAYKMAIELKPNYINALYNLGNTYDEAGNLSQALVQYRKVLQLNPRHSEAQLNMGVVYSHKGQYSKAKQAFEKAIDLNYRNTNAHFNLGYVYEVNGEGLAAIEAYKKAIELDPKHSEAHYNLGNVYAGLKMINKAIGSYKRAVETNSEHMDARVNLSVLSFQVKNYQDAVKYCDEARILGYDAPKKYLQALQEHRSR